MQDADDIAEEPRLKRLTYTELSTLNEFMNK